MSLSVRVASWRKFPIVLAGYDISRWEHIGGGEVYLSEYEKKLILFQQPPHMGIGPTHLQYRSPFGFLLAWPLCLHVWFQFKGQDVDKTGTTVPGTEKVFYWRFGARWEAEQGVYVVPSWYGPGLHWD